MKQIALLVLAILCFSSCGITYNRNFEHKYITGKVLQTLNDFEALVTTNSSDVVKIMTTKETLYDGKKISGLYVMTGTYQYTSTFGVSKTVPVYVKRKELLNP